jgi:hypothetical protein
LNSLDPPDELLTNIHIRKVSYNHHSYCSSLDKIIDEDYDVVVQQLRGDSTKSIEDYVLRIRTQEQELDKLSNDATKKARRVQGGKSYESPGSNSGKIPSIPNFILHKVQTSSVNRDLVLWLGIYNSEGRTIHTDELTTLKEDGDKRKRDDNSVGSNHNPPPGRGGKYRGGRGGCRKARRTKMSTTGTPSQDISRVSLKDPGENEGSDDTGDESDIGDKPPTRTSNKKNEAKSRSKKSGKSSKKKRRNPVI